MKGLNCKKIKTLQYHLHLLTPFYFKIVSMNNDKTS